MIQSKERNFENRLGPQTDIPGPANANVPYNWSWPSWARPFAQDLEGPLDRTFFLTPPPQQNRIVSSTTPVPIDMQLESLYQNYRERTPNVYDSDFGTLSSENSENASWSGEKVSSSNSNVTVPSAPQSFMNSRSHSEFTLNDYFCGPIAEVDYHVNHANPDYTCEFTTSQTQYLARNDSEVSCDFDLNEIVHDLFPIGSPKMDSKNSGQIGDGKQCGSLESMPIGLRNVMLNALRKCQDGDRKAENDSFSYMRETKVSKLQDKNDTPEPSEFMLKPWPINQQPKEVDLSQVNEKPTNVFVPPYPCLSAQDRWNQHRKKNRTEPEVHGRMVCAHCENAFDKIADYVKHLDEERVTHDNFCPDVNCAFAFLGFRFRWLLRRHICNHHLKEYNNQKSRRSTSVSEQSKLTNDFLSHVYVCRKANCLRAFYRSDSLSRHEKLLHAPNKKRKRREKLKLGKCDPRIFQ